MMQQAEVFESTDPSVISMIVGQLKGLQQQDHAELQSEQDSVLRMLLMQMGLAPGAPSAQAGAAEGADEYVVPVDDTMPIPEEEFQGGAGEIPDEVLAALMGAGGAAAMPIQEAGLGGEEALMGLPPEAYAEGEASTGLEHLSDEELMALLGGMA